MPSSFKMWLTKLSSACLLKKRRNFKRSASLLYKSTESIECGLEQSKAGKCNRVFANFAIRKQRFVNLILVIDFLKHFSRFRWRILMLIAVSLMFLNVLNSEILQSPLVTLKQVLVAVTDTVNDTNNPWERETTLEMISTASVTVRYVDSWISFTSHAIEVSKGECRKF